MYELICGSVFDKKCDMIVVPCNNHGGVTNSILNELTTNAIPCNVAVQEAGDVAFVHNLEKFTTSLVVGFAASVDASKHKSEEKYLHRICDNIKRYCKDNSLSIVNMPLLGAGAGGLSIYESFDIIKSQFQNESDILLRIFALSKEVYESLGDKDHTGEPVIKNPRVFISYTGENFQNAEWVKEFVVKLRKNGVNARADMYHLKPGQDLPQWMTNELIMADKVILICDKYYVQKADSRNGGVGWEAMIIQGDMLANNHSSKYICIVREESIDQAIPIFMKSRYALHWTESKITEEKFKELLYCLFDCNMEPEMGEIPRFIYEKMN